MIKTVTLACGVTLAALTIATPNVHAQFPALPPLPSAPASLPSRDISAEVKSMTQRYGLSDDQAKSVSAILKEQAEKAGGIAKDDSLTPEEHIHRLVSIREEEITRVSEALTPEQRKKYQADVHPARSFRPFAGGETAPSSPAN